MYIKTARRQLEIYGITGRRGHGKDTFAAEVLRANEALVSARTKSTVKQTFTCAHFADAIKTMSERIFGLTKDQMYEPSLKEIRFPIPLEMDLFIEKMREETGLAVQPAEKVACSPREVMQYFGTDYVRKAQDDYWIQLTMSFARGRRRVLIPDTRFPNEADAIRANGGRIIKIIRLGLDSGDTHASETSIDLIEPDLLLMVKNGDLSLVMRVATLIAQGKFEAAQRYDWRNAERSMNAYASGLCAEESARLLGVKHKDPYALYNLLEYYERPRRGRTSQSRVPHQVVSGVVSKWCSVCSSHQPLQGFNRSSTSWDGLAGLCRVCAAARNRDRYKKYDMANSLDRIYRQAERCAPQRGLAFELSRSDLDRLWGKQGGKCYYSGVDLTTDVLDPCKVSLDRLDSSKGYTIDNVVLCTKRINLMKREMSVIEFLEQVYRISLQNFPMFHKERHEILAVVRGMYG